MGCLYCAFPSSFLQFDVLPLVDCLLKMPEKADDLVTMVCAVTLLRQDNRKSTSALHFLPPSLRTKKLTSALWFCIFHFPSVYFAFDAHSQPGSFMDAWSKTTPSSDDSKLVKAEDGPWRTVGQYAEFAEPLLEKVGSVLREVFGKEEGEEIPKYISVHMRHGMFTAPPRISCLDRTDSCL